MLRLLPVVLLLASCVSSVRPEAARSATPEPGIWMSAPSDDDRTYVSVWERAGVPDVSLLCSGPCFPGGKGPEIFRKDTMRQLSPKVWEITLNPAHTMRLNLAVPSVELEGKQIKLTRLSFQAATTYLMGEYGSSIPMLFVSGGDYLLKEAPVPGAIDDSWVYLVEGNPKVQTIQTRNWEFFLAHEVPDEAPGTYFARLHGDTTLPGGEPAEFKVDTMRTNESDVAFWFKRRNSKAQRFTQTNDSNTHRYELCTGKKCQILYLADTELPPSCPGSWIALWFDLDGGWRTFSVSDNDELRDASCKVVYTMDRADESKVILKDLAGKATLFTSPPETQ